MAQVNIVAVMQLTRLLVPHMVERALSSRLRYGLLLVPGRRIWIIHAKEVPVVGSHEAWRLYTVAVNNLREQTMESRKLATESRPILRRSCFTVMATAA